MAGPRILLVDDDREFCGDLALVLGTRFDVRAVQVAEDALEAVQAFEPAAVLLDVNLGDDPQGGITLLERIGALAHPPAVIMLSGSTDVATVVAAMNRGALDYAVKPVEPSDLISRIERVLHLGRRELLIRAQRDELGRLTGNLVCADEAMHDVIGRADAVAGTGATVLLTGESGTGKEMIARHIHAGSGQRDGPFVAINCAAVPGELIESEIFGHGDRAFNDARTRMGKLEIAGGGTFFLDEIGEAPLELQAKMLRALGERVFVRVGENTVRPVNCRIIAATSRDLEQAIAAGRFREDLYYRLNIYRIELPPLRSRPGDVLVLADHFLAELAALNQRRIRGFSDSVRERIAREPWRGNVRELRNFVERAVINCRGPLVTLGDMFGETVADAAADGGEGPERETLSLGEAADRAKDAREKRYCISRLIETGGNVSRAAELSGVQRSAFQRKLRAHGIRAEDYRGSP